MFGGVVHEWGSYRNSTFDKMWGYHIWFDAGDKYWLIETDVNRFVVDGDGVGDVVVGEEVGDELERVESGSESVGEEGSESESGSEMTGVLSDIEDGEDIFDGTDVEEELYLNNGVSQEWMESDSDEL